MFKRLLIAASLTAVLGFALVSCGVGDSGGQLRWRSAIDVPMNFSRKVGQDLDSALLGSGLDLYPSCDQLTPEDLAELPPGVDCEYLSPEDLARLLPDFAQRLPHDFLLDLGAETVSTTSDVMDILKKLINPKIEYSIGVTNSTSATLTFYGMLFAESDSAAGADVMEYYDIIASDDTSGGRVNVFGPDGLCVEPGKTIRYPNPPGQSKPLRCDLVIGSRALSWRWLVKLDNVEYGGLRDTANTTDTVGIKLKMRFSGENSFDSLFSL